MISQTMERSVPYKSSTGFVGESDLLNPPTQPLIASITVPENRYTRQSAVISRETLENANCAVIGTGAIGRQVAIMAGCMGFGKITLYDPDTVDEVNFATQGFPSADLGESKVDSVGRSISIQNPDPKISLVCSRFSVMNSNKAWGDGKNIAFLCVDTITDRAFIHSILKNTKAEWVIDGRMSSETRHIITCAMDDPYYETTLFSQNQAFRGSCTAKSTIYCASAAAADMLSQARKILSGFSPTKDFVYDMFSNSLTINEA